MSDGTEAAPVTDTAAVTTTTEVKTEEVASTDTSAAQDTIPSATTEETVAVATTESADQSETYKVPEQYKGKPWASKIKSDDDLWKALDGAQTLIGRKEIIAPLDYSKATPAEIEEYHAKTRPADKTAYEFDPETPDFMKEGVGEILYKHGIPAAQANAFMKDYLAFENEKAGEHYGPDSFLTDMKEAFGNDHEKVTGQLFNVMKKNLSVKDQEVLENIPNQYLATFYRATHNLIKAYGIKSTDLASKQAGPAEPQDIKEVRRSIRAELNGLSSKNHTAAEKAALIAKLDATYR